MISPNMKTGMFGNSGSEKKNERMENDFTPITETGVGWTKAVG